MKKHRVSLRTKYIIEAYGFIGPWIIGFFIFLAIPIFRSLYYSFHELQVKTDGLQATFIGWKNYSTAFTTDVTFLPILLKTVGVMLVQVPLIVVFSMFVALLVNRPMKGKMLFRAIFFLPVIITSGAIIDRLKELNALTLPMIESTGMQFFYELMPEGFIWPVMQALDYLSIIMWGSGVQILIFIAALQTIPTHLYEASKCDGATAWENFWKITFPMILPMVFVNTMFSIVVSFTNSSNEMMKYIFDVTFIQIQFGYASSLGWIYFIAMFIVICFTLYLFRTRNKAI